MKAAWLGVAMVTLFGTISAPSLAAVAPPTTETNSTTVYDPFEKTNRTLFRFSQTLDRSVIRPSALEYKSALPNVVRTGVSNALNNLGEPATFINDVLQLHPNRAGVTLARFVVNSTLGLGGLIDIQGMNGAPIHYSDFGQTLGRYGVPPGPYIYIPIIGPSNLRDGTGHIVDSLASPLNLHVAHTPLAARIGVTVLDGINTRAEYDDALQDIHRMSADEYATLRSAYMQNRRSLIVDQNKAVQQLPDFDTPSAAPSHAEPKP